LTELQDVLIVDDDVVHASTIAKILRTRYAVRIAVGLRDAVHELARRVPQVMVCALELPPFRGDTLLAMVAREHPHVRRVLFAHARVEAGLAAVHAVLEWPVKPAALFAAIGED
jgi:DNA-binding NtrC family response regulator